MKFRQNLGALDRVLRGGVALTMGYVGFFGQLLVADDIARFALGGVGVFMLGIAILGHCPMYEVIGFSTATTKDTEATR